MASCGGLHSGVFHIAVLSRSPPVALDDPSSRELGGAQTSASNAKILINDVSVLKIVFGRKALNRFRRYD